MLEKALMIKLEKELEKNNKNYMRGLFTITEKEKADDEIIEMVFNLYKAYKTR